MKKDPNVFLSHILESIDLIQTYLEGVTEEQFHMSRAIQDMIVRRIEIIGEATKNLPEELRQKHSEVPWKKMAGMRDIIAHQYFDIDYMVVWDTITNFLPVIREQIQEISNE